MTDPVATPNHYETDDTYPGVVAMLAPDLRVIVCKDHIQWIVQRLAGGRWRSSGYCISREGLIRVGTHFLPRGTVEDRLSHLPDYLGRAARSRMSAVGSEVRAHG